jgi:hypothetical protein
VDHFMRGSAELFHKNSSGMGKHTPETGLD